MYIIGVGVCNLIRCFTVFLGITAFSMQAMEVENIPAEVPGLKMQCMKMIHDKRAAMPELYDSILSELPAELSLFMIANLGDYDLARKFAAARDIDQNVADLIVAHTPDIIRKIIQDPSLKTIFPERMLEGENRNFLSWALYRQYIEDQAGSKTATYTRENTFMTHFDCIKKYDDQSIEEIVQKKGNVAIWVKAEQCFLKGARADEQDDIDDLVLEDVHGMPRALYRYYPQSFMGPAFVDPSYSVALVGMQKRDCKFLVDAQTGLSFFKLSESKDRYPNYLSTMYRITAVYFSSNMRTILIEKESGKIYEFSISKKAHHFIKNFNVEAAAALLVGLHLGAFIYHDLEFSQFIPSKVYKPLEKIMQKFLAVSVVKESEYLFERFMSEYNELVSMKHKVDNEPCICMLPSWLSSS